MDEPGQPPPRLEWQDVLALIIAAYQIVLPVVFLFVVAVLAVYFLFWLLFVR